MTFKEALARRYGKIGGSQTRLAQALGIAQPTVSGWTRGQLPSEDLQPKVAQELHISVEELRGMFEQKAGGMGVVVGKLDELASRLDRIERLLMGRHQGDCGPGEPIETIEEAGSGTPHADATSSGELRGTASQRKPEQTRRARASEEEKPRRRRGPGR